MRSPNICSQNKKRGFSLIEVVVSLAILGLLLGFGLIMTIDAYRGSVFRSQTSSLVGILQKARSYAMNNKYQTPWGVCYDTHAPAYILFPGTAYIASNPLNEVLPAQHSVLITGMSLCSSGSGIIFAQLAGTTTPATITLSQQAHTESIAINYEGRIDW